MSDLTQKNCPKCGARAVKTENDRMGMRTCACGHTWFPSKLKEVPTKELSKE